MSYNVQPLRTQHKINDFLFRLRRNKNAKRDVFLFLIGINSGKFVRLVDKLLRDQQLYTPPMSVIEYS
ncbi:hypothetical protein AX762_05360 [Alkalibacterium sp. 20]|nr:hypothetical protein AX762_05360 [Alkalibacterium sp. 20]